MEDDYGGSSRSSSGYSRGYGGDYGGSSKGSVGLGGREGQSSSYQYGGRGGGGGYSDSGYGRGGYSDEPPPMTDAEFQVKKQQAVRRMEDSSFNSLRTLHDTVRMGTETTEELDRQAEALDRVETRLDEIHVGLDKGERNLRKIKSPFGGMMNYFSKKKSVSEVTDPKGYKPSSGGDSKKSGSGAAAGGKGGGKQQAQAQLPQQTYKTTGSEVVDKNLDLMGKALDDLMGIGELIGEQLDDSDQQVDRIAYKMERDHVKIEKLNKGIKKELYK
jgi:synaptosomal-associated protein 29